MEEEKIENEVLEKEPTSFDTPPSPIDNLSLEERLSIFSMLEKHISKDELPKSTLKEFEELELVQNLIQRVTEEHTFIKLCTILMTTQYVSTHELVFKFFNDCLTSPIELVDLGTTGKLKKSNSGEFHFDELRKKRGVHRSMSLSGKHPSLEMLVTDIEDVDNAYIPLIEFLYVLQKVFNYMPAEEKNYLVILLISKTLTMLAPEKSNVNTDIVLYFKQAISCITHIIETSDEAGIHAIVQQIKDSIYEIIFTPDKISNFVIELIPIIANCVIKLQSANLSLDPITRYMQDIWIALATLIAKDFTIFKTNSSDIGAMVRATPPLVSLGKHTLSISAANSQVQELITQLQTTVFSKVDEVSITFRRIAPYIPQNHLAYLSQSEALLLFSIFLLERERIKRGIFAPFLEYFASPHSIPFDACLDSIVDPIFNNFIETIGHMQSTPARISSVTPAAMALLGSLETNNPRVCSVCHRVIPPLFENFSFLLFNDNVLTKLFVSKSDHSHQQMLWRVVQSLVARCGRVAPFLTTAALQKFLLHRMSTGESYPIREITDALPHNIKGEFQKYLSVRSYISGVYNALFTQNIDVIESKIASENEEAKAFLISKEIIRTKNDDLLELIPYTIPGETVLSAWADIATSSPELGQEIVERLFVNFTTQVQAKKGLFDTEYDHEDIRAQCLILNFLTEFIRLDIYTANIAPLASILDKKMQLKHPGSTPVLITASLFLVAICLNESTTKDIFGLASSNLTELCLLIVSMRSTADVFRYIRKKDCYRLESLIPLFVQVVPKLKLDLNPEADVYTMQKFTNVVVWCLCQTLMHFWIFVEPTKPHPSAIGLVNANWLKPRHYYVTDILPILCQVSPTSIPGVIQTLHAEDIFVSQLPSLVQNYPQICQEPLIVPALTLSRDPECVKQLGKASVKDHRMVLTLLREELLKDSTSAAFVGRALDLFSEDEAMLFVPQLVQAIQIDKCKEVRKFLIRMAGKSIYFSHRLMWQINDTKCNYLKKMSDAVSLTPEQAAELTKYFNPLPKIEQAIQDMMSETNTMEIYFKEFSLIDRLDKLSQNLLKVPKEERTESLRKQLEEFELAPGMYLPSHPSHGIVRIVPEGSRALKSHARVPIMVDFECRCGSEIVKRACIFKSMDDVRNDCLISQLLTKFSEIFKTAGVNAWVNAYSVFSTGQDRGVIEVIENAMSRHDIGVRSPCCLLQYFVDKYGPVGSKAFDKAQDNFIRSLAPYSLMCYLFQVKDRHNANIMIDEAGHIMHIDFGFIFEISPGGNIKFERAPFKLTREYIDLLGGSREAAPFVKFVSLLTKCFIAVQAHHQEIEAIVDLMQRAELPCFRPDTVKKLNARFELGRSASMIPDFINSLVNDSFESLTTSAYDSFQNSQNAIYY